MSTPYPEKKGPLMGAKPAPKPLRAISRDDSDVSTRSRGTNFTPPPPPPRALSLFLRCGTLVIQSDASWHTQPA